MLMRALATLWGRLSTRVRHDDAVVHENAMQEKFAEEVAAEDAAFGEAREWIDAKCQLN
jgi:hypothetical protein